MVTVAAPRTCTAAASRSEAIRNLESTMLSLKIKVLPVAMFVVLLFEFTLQQKVCVKF